VSRRKGKETSRAWKWVVWLTSSAFCF